MKKTAKRILKTIVSLTLVAGLALPGKAAVIVNAKDGLPDKYDLRDDGLVTPVKFQNPWGSCWAFGGVAAIESSLLSYMAETTQSYKEKYGEDFNISEKHVAWFAKHPITKDENASQEGEGLYPFNSTDQSEYYSGGTGILIGTLLASGIGPLMESEFPYQGKEGITAYDYYLKHPDDALKDYEAQLGTSIEEKYATDKKNGTLEKDIKKLKDNGVSVDSTAADITEEEFKKAYTDYYISAIRKQNSYSSHDDWTIDEKDKDGNLNRDRSDGFVLSDANVLPELCEKENGKWIGLNEEGLRAVKKELLSGRAVAISYHADQSRPGQPSDKSYINTDTWSHYTYDDVPGDHTVCIVGYDDTYSKNNFVKGHRPPGDGAFIVKNSWGSQTDYVMMKNGERIGFNEWGVKNEDGNSTGYFYLSYYDKTLDTPETMVFTATLYKKASEIYTLAYDYMPATDRPVSVIDSKVLKTANVFKNDSGKDLELLSMSTKNGNENAQVLYEVYKLKDDAKSPEDGEFIGKRRAYYQYAGYHREDLTTPVTIKNGETFSIVTTETFVEDDGRRKYEYVLNCGGNKKNCEQNHGRYYSVGVVNKGESYLYTDGEWFDWADVKTEELVNALGEHYRDLLEIDNFSIKAFVSEVGKE